jgi:hypothetical protein
MAAPPARRCRHASRSPITRARARAAALCAAAFTRPPCAPVRTRVAGALLASGRRTVTAALRAVGRGAKRHVTLLRRGDPGAASQRSGAERL